MTSAQPEGAVDEVAPLNNNPVPVDAHNDNCTQVICSRIENAASCCRNRHYRILAISSIICGISCIGILSLINSVKAEDAERADRQTVEQHSKKAKKFGIISIVTWFALIIFSLMMLALVSYLITLQE